MAEVITAPVPVDRTRLQRIDPLGAVLTLIAAVALIFLPFVVFKTNRIVPGDPRGLLDVLPAWRGVTTLGLLAGIGIVSMFIANARARLIAALIGVVVIAMAVASAADELTPAGSRVVRIAAGAGFWILLVTLGLMATDAITRMRPGPLLRVAFLVGFLAITLWSLAHGTFDNLSVMREYAVNADRFAREVRQHVWLALGSLAAAVIVAIPIGVLCHRVPRLRPGIQGTLNIVQTIPAIALFGILMAPLAALATAFPWVGELGIRGIGAAPAAVALFLYSLLPIVVNTAVGLNRVSRSAADAARGMGMTDWQVLTSIELPLAVPVIITGVRIVLVQNIGMVTIAALIGGGGLGTFVFQGIGQTAIDLVLLGAIPTVVLAFSAAVILDAIVEAMDRTRA